jgi:segregation and condensation protein A
VPDVSALSRPPLNVLIDPSLARRKSPWEIDLSDLLELFFQAITQGELVDMRAAGTAVLSAAAIYKVKVESLFLFEKLRAMRRPADAAEPPQIIVMPFRYEVYSTDVEELFDELGKILQDAMSSGRGDSAEGMLPAADLPPPDFGDYTVGLEGLLSEFRKVLVERLKVTGKAALSELLAGLSPIDAARVFILLLFSANSGEVVINQEEGDEDALVVSVGQLE